MLDALPCSLCSLTEVLPSAYLRRDRFPYTDFPPAQHAQRAVSNFSQLPVDGVRAAQKPYHWGPPWHQFVHRDIKSHIATRENPRRGSRGARAPLLNFVAHRVD